MEHTEAMQNANEGIVKVPKFLKTLCTLSFVMCGLMILMQVWTLKKVYLPSEQDLVMEQQQLEMVQSNNPRSYDAAVKSMESRGNQGIITLVMEVLAFIGVMQMLQLKKTGFYIYVFAELIPYIITLVMDGYQGMIAIAGSFGETMQTVAWVVVGVTILIDLLFIFLYSKQLKFMS